MLKDRKIESQKKTIKRLFTENENLKARNKSLEAEIDKLMEQIESQKGIVEAAEKYKDEHNKVMICLYEAKERYDIALKELVAEQIRYKEDFKKVIAELK